MSVPNPLTLGPRPISNSWMITLLGLVLMTKTDKRLVRYKVFQRFDNSTFYTLMRLKLYGGF